MPKYNSNEIRISSSKMDSLDWCERKYRIKNIEKIPSKVFVPALAVGRICHSSIDKFWKHFRLNLDTYIQDINDFYKLISKPKLYGEHKAKYKIYMSNFLNFQIRRIKIYKETYGKDIRMIKKLFFPILTEKRGTMQISSNIKFSYVVDSLFWNPTGNILIDWKTDNECTEAKFISHIPQLNRYSESITQLKLNCKLIGIFFLKESLFYSRKRSTTYSLERDVLSFVRRLQICKFNKVPIEDNWKCCTTNFQCEYYPKPCSGSFK